MNRSKKEKLRQKLILLTICASLAACQTLPVSQPTVCEITPPRLEQTVMNDTHFIVPIDEMSQLTLYIEQLRQCSGIE